MARSHVRALVGLVRQCASSIEVSSLPPGSRFFLPAWAGPSLFGAPLSPASAMQGGYNLLVFSRMAVSLREIHTSISTDSSAMPDEFIQDPAYAACVDYLLTKLTLPKQAVVDMVSTIALNGFQPSGQMYARNAPLALDLDDTVRPMVEFLETIPGIDLTRAVRNAPYLLLTPPGEKPLLEANSQWMTRILGLEGPDLGKIINGNAYVLTRSTKDAQAVVNKLFDLGFSTAQARSMVLRFPRIMAMRDNRLEYTLQSLRSLGLDEEQLKKVLWKQPAAFSLTSGKMEANGAWLRERGLAPGAVLAAAITRFPTMLAYSVPEKLGPTLDFLQNDLELSDGDIEHILIAAPDVFGRKLDTLRANVETMRRVGVDHENLKKFIMGYPGSLRINLEAEPYASKIRFVKDVLERELGPVLAVHPKIVTYSMERLQSRAAFLEKCGRSRYSITAWLSCNDVVFCERHARASVDEWSEFIRHWVPST